MPPEPVREKVMVALADQLATITAGDTYWTTPSLVTRELLWITQYNQPLGVGPDPTATQLDAGPVLGIMRSSGSTFERILHGAANRPVVEAFEHEMRVTVWGFVKATPGVIAGTWAERLFQDHLACLLATSRLGTLARQSIEPDGALDTDDGFLEPLAFFAQDWLVCA